MLEINKDRNEDIFNTYMNAPRHLRGRYIQRMMEKYELSRSQVYNIIKTKREDEGQ